MAHENLIATVFMLCIWKTSAICGICDPFVNIRCTSNNQYQFCGPSGIGVGLVYTCPSNMSCSTEGPGLCSDAIPECKCGICNQIPTTTTTLACVSDTQYAICNIGDDLIPDTTAINCPPGMQCSEAGNPLNPCVVQNGVRANSCDVGSSQVCTNTGRYPVAGTMCKTYNLCTNLQNGTIVYYTYTCPGTSVFNPNTQTCSRTYTCTE